MQGACSGDAQLVGYSRGVIWGILAGHAVGVYNLCYIDEAHIVVENHQNNSEDRLRYG